MSPLSTRPRTFFFRSTTHRTPTHSPTQPHPLPTSSFTSPVFNWCAFNSAITLGILLKLNTMKTIIEHPDRHHNSRTILGAVILVIGCLFLINQFDLPFIPDWLFSWPIVLIGFGIYTGSRHNFQNKSWFILVILGFAFLLENSGLFIDDVIWPATLILLGLFVIFRNSFRHNTTTTENN